jgi:hypothetical protein
MSPNEMILKECLKCISETEINIGDLRKHALKKVLENYSDEQLYTILTQTPSGVIANDIFVHFIPNVGFRVSNDTRGVGKLPICNLIQRKLNEKLMILLKK